MGNEILKKESIFKQLTRRKLQILGSILALLIIAGVLSGVYLYQKVKKSRAAREIAFIGEKPNRTTIFPCDIGWNCVYSIPADETRYDDDDIIIDRSTLRIYGRHRFKNMTIKNAGILTTSEIAPNISYNPTTFELTDEGKDQKVDFELSGILRFETGGKIDVSGQGYRGGDPHQGDGSYGDCGLPIPSRCGQGDGPGAGQNAERWDSNPVIGGGGGYGGIGGLGYGNVIDRNPATGGPFYGDLTSSLSTLWHGSGGGSARMTGLGYYYRGAAGGGAAKITASDIQTDGFGGNGIFANGSRPSASECYYNPVLPLAVTMACGGAGSGGSVYLRLTNYSGSAGVNADAGTGVTTRPESKGQDGALVLKGLNYNAINPKISLSARGGDGGSNESAAASNDYRYSSGGGGRILVEVIPYYTMKKWLEPVERSSNALVRDFNPYALRVGDKIKVGIRVSNLTVGTVIEDSILWDNSASAGSKKCIPYDISVWGTYANDKVTWTYPGGGGQPDFYYYCQVKK